MRVVKRDGTIAPVSFDEITKRLEAVADGLGQANYHLVAQKVIQSMSDHMPTEKLDDMAIDVCASLVAEHPDYDRLAVRLAMSQSYKRIARELHVSPECAPRAFVSAMTYAQEYTQFFTDAFMSFVHTHRVRIEQALIPTNDCLFDIFGLKTLEKGYLFRANGTTIETPQFMWMRVACALNLDNIDRAVETYYALSHLRYTHASPTLFNAGTRNGQLSSCFFRNG